MTAITHALEEIKEYFTVHSRSDLVVVRTNFLFVIYGLRYEKKGPKKYNEFINRYKQNVETIRQLALAMPSGVLFQHVRAHQGDPGNEIADLMARQGAMGVDVKPSQEHEPQEREYSVKYIPKHSVMINVV